MSVFQSNQTLVNFEAERKRLDGTRWWILMNTQPLVFEGKNAGIVWHTDITERKSAEKLLRQSEEKLRDFAESASDWFWEMGPNLKFTFGSDRFLEITGWLREDVYGRGRDFLLHPELENLESEKWQNHFADLERHEPFANFEYVARTKADVPVHISLSRQRGNGPQAIAPFSCTQSVTQATASTSLSGCSL